MMLHVGVLNVAKRLIRVNCGILGACSSRVWRLFAASFKSLSILYFFMPNTLSYRAGSTILWLGKDLLTQWRIISVLILLLLTESCPLFANFLFEVMVSFAVHKCHASILLTKLQLLLSIEDSIAARSLLYTILFQYN